MSDLYDASITIGVFSLHIFVAADSPEDADLRARDRLRGRIFQQTYDDQDDEAFAFTEDDQIQYADVAVTKVTDGYEIVEFTANHQPYGLLEPAPTLPRS